LGGKAGIRRYGFFSVPMDEVREISHVIFHNVGDPSLRPATR
jgi:imidazoleglycerol phosphate dehydratase HisB